MRSLAEDVGIRLSITIHTDSSAAKGITERSGIGRVRHLDVADLWVQDRVRSKEIRIRKIAGTENPPDILTKHVSREVLDYHVSGIGLRRAQEGHYLASRASGGICYLRAQAKEGC
eukprot:9591646-Karenia_brevis.AAC.1